MNRFKAAVEAVAAHARKNGIRKTLNAVRMTNGLRKSGVVMPAGAKLRGTDAMGNKYYESLEEDIFMDRWVVYANSDAHMYDATQIPPEWHSWLHRMTDTTPEEDPRSQPLYQMEHVSHSLPSQYGIGATYVPPGHALRGDERKRYSKYESWTPSAASK